MPNKQNKIILHLDMNSYFASVEQQANPLLRGKPVGVCSYLSKNGCILSASIEAKAKGIKTGDIAWQAKEKCPGITLLENSPDKYRHLTGQIFSLLSEYTDRLEPYSIDEAFLDLTGHAYDLQEARAIGREIKKRLKQEIGDWLSCSIGIAPTKFLAKLAANLQKPDGLTILDEEDLSKVYDNLELTDLFGINKRTAKRLQALGINTPNELRNYPVTNLMQALGKYGYYLWRNVNGYDVEEVRTAEDKLPKSIGHSYCLPKKTRDKQYLKTILFKLCEKTGRRLRTKGLEAKQITIAWAYANGGGDHKQHVLNQAIFDSWDIFCHAYLPLKTAELTDKISMLAISVGQLDDPSGQLSIFDNEERRKKSLVESLDEINDRYGEYTIRYGQMWDTQNQARDRIGFRKTVDFIKADPRALEYLNEHDQLDSKP